MKLKNKKIWCTVMIVIIVAIDQITKYFAKACLYGKGAKPFIKGVVEFVYAQNTGVAFSMFDGGRWFFVALTAVVLLFCILYMYKGKGQNNLWLFWSLGVIVSGAIGNLIDRIYLGYVIDFINPTFVMEIFMSNPKQIVSKEFFIEKIWGYESDVEYNNIEVYISFLRKKLTAISAPVQIKTARGIGYSLE